MKFTYPMKFSPLIMILLLIITASSAHALSNELKVKDWRLKWVYEDEPVNSIPPLTDSWFHADPEYARTHIPDDSIGMWIHISVPPTMDWRRPSLLIEQIYGLDITVYDKDAQPLFESKRSFFFERNKLLMPLDVTSSSTDLYIRILSGIRAGPHSEIQIGEFSELSNRYVRPGLFDLLFGAAISFLGFIVLLCSIFLNKHQRGMWVSFSLIAFSTGLLILTYSQLPYIYYSDYGHFFMILFDLSMLVLFPALNYYTNLIFDRRFTFFTRFSKLQASYSLFCVAIVIFYKATGSQHLAIYHLFTGTILGPLILVQMIIISSLTLFVTIKGNRDALLFTIGVMTLALLGTIDLILYYLSDSQYILFLWKIGVAALIVTLAIILVRRVSRDYSKLLSYSKELEQYNQRLQPTEKMKIISDLAASVAHEIRNPLQVTRGFLQLLIGKSNEEHTPYFNLAIHELDRASIIITDFLTFAKPELESYKVLLLSNEIRRIDTIISPLAALNNSKLNVQIKDDLHIMGNSSKLKQVLINLIKNSIEAIKTEGVITIEVYSEDEFAVIRVADNGEGMSEEQLAQIGAPFFSTKTKGTGLGLMVTYRIIETMKGTLEFHSQEGKGTEAIVRFPLLQQESVPGNVRA